MEKPGYMSVSEDGLRRITAVGRSVLDGVWEDPARHGYSLRQPWNCDGTILHLDKGYSESGDLFLDGATYDPMFARSQPGDDRRWHPTEPNIRVCVGDDRVEKYDVNLDSSVTVAILPESSARMKKGNLTDDGRYLAVACDETTGYIVDLFSGAVGEPIDLSYIPDLSWFGLSRSGNYAIAHESGTDLFHVYTVSGLNAERHWSSEAYGMPSHYDFATYAGLECVVGVAKSGDHSGLVIRRTLLDGSFEVLSDGGYASHTSCRNVVGPYCFTAYNDNPDHPPYRNVVVRWPLDGSKQGLVVCNTHREKHGYDDETHPCPDPSGTRLILASNWDSSGPVESYVSLVGRDEPPPTEPPTTEPPTTEPPTDSDDLVDSVNRLSAAVNRLSSTVERAFNLPG